MQQTPAPISTTCTYTHANSRTHQSPTLTPTTHPTTYPPTKPTTPFNTYPVPTYIEPNDDDRDDTPSRPTLLAI
jgi:hypothetical protein